MLTPYVGAGSGSRGRQQAGLGHRAAAAVVRIGLGRAGDAADEAGRAQGGGVVDLPDAGDLAVVDGEVLRDAERAQARHVHVVQQHPLPAGLRDFLAEFWPEQLEQLKRAMESGDDR